MLFSQYHTRVKASVILKLDILYHLDFRTIKTRKTCRQRPIQNRDCSNWILMWHVILESLGPPNLSYYIIYWIPKLIMLCHLDIRTFISMLQRGTPCLYRFEQTRFWTLLHELAKLQDPFFQFSEFVNTRDTTYQFRGLLYHGNFYLFAIFCNYQIMHTKGLQNLCCWGICDM